MSVLVTDTGFDRDDWHAGFTSPEALGEVSSPETRPHHQIGLELGLDADLSALQPHLARIALIRVAFGSFADGRGFSLAQRLRQMGYRGRLRASGHVLADQYPMARRCGFDEVEISQDMAQRQPEPAWRQHSDWRGRDYQSRLRA